MIKLIIPLCIATLFFSCKKHDTINASQARILQILYKDSTGAANIAIVFDYDDQGRIIKVSSVDHTFTATVADITYNGSDIIITPAAVLNFPAETIISKIRYTVNAAGNPLTRIASTTTTFGTPNPPQYEYKTDTSAYAYDGSGLLAKKTNTSFDSLWFDPDPADIEIQINTGNSTAIYTNTDNMLAQIDLTGYDSSRYTFGTKQLNYLTKTVETDKFTYTQNYKTQTDFSNSIILTEYGILPNTYYPLNKSYSHFPDNISTSSASTDLSTGSVTSNNETLNFRINNNNSGLITNLSFLAGNGNVSFSQTITYK